MSECWIKGDLSLRQLADKFDLTSGQMSGLTRRKRDLFPMRTKEYNRVSSHASKSEEIQKMLNVGRTIVSIAKHFSISRESIYKVIEDCNLDYSFKKVAVNAGKASLSKKNRKYSKTRSHNTTTSISKGRVIRVARVGEGYNILSSGRFLHMSGGCLSDKRSYAWRGTYHQAENMIKFASEKIGVDFIIIKERSYDKGFSS